MPRKELCWSGVTEKYVRVVQDMYSICKTVVRYCIGLNRNRIFSYNWEALKNCVFYFRIRLVEVDKTDSGLSDAMWNVSSTELIEKYHPE